jgi:hypothetical protein
MGGRAVIDTMHMDTAETIHPVTAGERAVYESWGADLRADAEALLATVRHLLTGREIDMCEALVDLDGLGATDVAPMASLRVQFYAQICNHKEGFKP